ncbi:MAG: DUF2935 domain-containing protein [Bacillota bacterium]
MEKAVISEFYCENSFWLRILKDHTTFMFNSFSPMERNNIQTTQDFMKSFEEQLNMLSGIKSAEADKNQMLEFNKAAYKLSCSFLNFQQNMLYKRMLYEVNLNMTPTFLEHMLREGTEYLRQLDYLNRYLFIDSVDKTSIKRIMHQHKLWQPDAAGHAAFIQAGLDMTEKPMIEIAREFQKDFEAMFFKSYELKKMLDPEYPDMPQIAYLNHQASQKIMEFMEYLCRLKALIEEKKIMSILSPLVPDHMQREEDYYLTKLKQLY